MRPNKPPSGKCPQSEREACALQCKHNLFEADELRIESWELKCLDCGHRETIAYRNDEEDEIEIDCDPAVCPFCKQDGLCVGKNPCET